MRNEEIKIRNAEPSVTLPLNITGLILWSLVASLYFFGYNEDGMFILH